jgi:hypothetical protein
MSIFHRKLFTHTPYHHYGTGIASGLVERQGFAVGGRVKLSKGGDSSKNTVSDAIKRSEIMSQKRKLFDGDHGLGINPDKSSFINTIYNLEFIKEVEALGITREQFKNLEKEDRQNIAKQINDKIVSKISSDYQIDISYIEKAFGDAEGMVTDSQKAIDQLLREDQFGVQLKKQQTQRYQSGYDTMIGNIETEGPMAFETIPGTDEITGTDEKKDTDDGDTDGDTDVDTDGGITTVSPPPSEIGVDKTGIRGALTSDEGRQSQVEFYKNLQKETELMEKARRQAIQDSFIAAGSVDYDGDMMRSLSLAFQDPMSKLRDREYGQAENIYDTVRDQTTEDLRRGETIKLLDYLSQNPEQQALAKTVLGGSGTATKPLEADPKFLETARNMTAEEIAAYYGIPIEQVEANLLQIQQVLAQDLQYQTKTDIASNLPAPSVTEETITKPLLFQNGGRVGYQEGAMVEPSETPVDQSVQQDSVEQIYMQLREALPDYIQDNVVELLAKDSEALSEFVEIKTTTQVQEFEDKYRVELNLPQEDQVAAFPESQIM